MGPAFMSLGAIHILVRTFHTSPNVVAVFLNTQGSAKLQVEL